MDSLRALPCSRNSPEILIDAICILWHSHDSLAHIYMQQIEVMASQIERNADRPLYPGGGDSLPRRARNTR